LRNFSPSASLSPPWRTSSPGVLAVFQPNDYSPTPCGGPVTRLIAAACPAGVTGLGWPGQPDTPPFVSASRWVVAEDQAQAPARPG